MQGLSWLSRMTSRYDKPEPKVPYFASMCSLAEFLRGSPWTSTHRRKQFGGCIIFQQTCKVAILKSTTGAKIIDAISPMFARFGAQFLLRTDNGPQFVSEEFSDVMAAS